MALTIAQVQAQRDFVQDKFLGVKPSFNGGRIGRLLVPELDQDVVQGIMYEIAPSDALRLYTDEVGQSGVAELVDFDPTTTNLDPTVKALKYNLRKRVNLASMSDQGLRNLLGILAAQTRNALDLGFEDRVASLLQNASTYATTAVTNSWGDASDTPVADILGGIESVRTQSGMTANSMIVPRATWIRLIQTSEAQTFIGGFGNRTATDVGVVTSGALEMALGAAAGIDDFKIFVGSAVKNTAAKGQTASITDVWTDATVTIGYFDRNTPQAAETRDDGRPLGAPGGMDMAMDGLTAPAIAATGPQHGEFREWEDDETGDLYGRFNLDYEVIAGVADAAHVLTNC